jgi:D-alanyl-D-alanine carboxypeptidase/D-alanyl-D-alanine-endopeptidase (penicillin-binding protein 4)
MAFRWRNSRSTLTSPRAGLALIAAVLFFAAAPQRLAAQGATDVATEAGLVARVRETIDRAGLGEQLGVSIVDARTGRAMFAHNATQPLNPASNMKLITSAVTLIELGADFRMLTGVYGHVQDGAVTGGLYLKGGGDPTLTSADLAALAEQLAARGIRQVDEVVVDGSYFDDQVLPPGFGEQPNEVSPFRAAVAAVSVNENAFTLRVNPAATAGAPASVWTDAEGHFTVSNGVTTAASGAPNIVAVQSQKADKLVLRLTGSVPIGIAGVSYRRRVESPLYYAGYALVEALRAQHIQVPRRVRLGPTESGLALLASHESPPLAAMLSSLGKHSDNFVAEMLLKVLAAERVGRPGRSELGAEAALRTLKRLGVPTNALAITNGSGLFGKSRVAAAQLTKLLSTMFNDPALQPEYIAQLAVGGVDGTLARRFAQLPAPRIVRAKTGTLDDVIALSGYVLGRVPERAIAFSVLANGVHGKQGAARALADQIASDIAQHLWLLKPAGSSAGASPTP